MAEKPKNKKGFNLYWIYAILMMIGLYGMVAKNNLFKKVIGMSIFQTAIIVFYVSIGAKKGGGIPIVPHENGHGVEHAVDVAHDNRVSETTLERFQPDGFTGIF